MKLPASPRRAAGFTLAEMMIVISIIVVLAALTLGGYNYASRGAKRRTTEATMTAITSTLDRYKDQFGEYPEPVNAQEMFQVRPGRAYNVGGAKCLYQAIRGDGFDAIKGASSSSGTGSGASDGNFDDTEIPNVLFRDMPPTMWRKLNGVYMIVDGFFNPFQYVKAAVQTTAGNAQATTVNTTYDLWSYGEDEVNISAKSFDTIKQPTIANQWIKNW